MFDDAHRSNFHISHICNKPHPISNHPGTQLVSLPHVAISAYNE
nr:MAG TPA: hypothetical protein [Caudoviricetes sp.]